MEQMLETVLQISLSTAAVIGILLLLVPMWQRWYSARWRKVIWFVVAIRLLLPFSLELPEAPVQMNVDLAAAPMFWQSAMPDSSSVENGLMNQKPVAEPFISETQLKGGNHTTSESSELSGLTVRGLSRGMLWCIVWLFGMLLFLCWHSGQYLRFYWKVLRAAKQFPNSEALLQQASQGIKINRYPIVLVSSKVQGPMLVGFVKPTILLPNKLYGERELILILRHELVHYQQKDLWYKLLLVLANAVHWFNPLVYLMVRQASRDLEQVCDEKVIENQDIEYRKAYSMTILQAMSSSRGIVLSTYLSKQAQNSKKRFTDILQPKQYKKGIVTLIVIVGLAVLASGCLQMGEKDQGLALYQQVKQWLPEDAIQNPETYKETESEPYVGVGIRVDKQPYFCWQEEKIEKTDANWTSRLYVDENGLEYFYKRDLYITISPENQEILSFSYACDKSEIDVVTDGNVWYLDDKKCAEYVQKFVRSFIKGGKELQIELKHKDLDGQTFEVKDDTNHFLYNITVGKGYITRFEKKYDNPKLQQQTFDWLQEQYQQQMGEAYQLTFADQNRRNISFSEDMQYKNGEEYIATYNGFFVRGRPKLSELQQKRLEQLRQTNEQQYQFLLDYLQEDCVGFTRVLVKTDMLDDKNLDFSTAQVFLDDSERALNWQVEQERWQIIWTATGFANAYVEKQKDVMALLGTVKQTISSEYENSLPLAYFLNACSKNSIDYAGGTSFHFQIELWNGTESHDYLDMTLEKIDGTWMVTNAALEK